MNPDNDIDLPNVWGDDEPESETVSELVAECKKHALAFAIQQHATAERNERMIVGDQFIRVNDNGEVSEIEDWPSYVPKTSRNLLRNLSLTWTSRLLEDSPWVACFASEPGIDESKAQIANKILENCRQNHDFDTMEFDAGQLVQPHSCVAFKTVWDPLKGPPSPGVPQYDEFGAPVYGPDGEAVMDGVGEATGDVSWTVTSIFDYGTDGAEHIEDSRWCYFVKVVDEYDARALMAAAGLDYEMETTETPDVWGVQRRGVEITELWWRPDTRFPKGLFAVLVGNEVVQAAPFPYKHGELPLAVWKCGARRNSPFGSTHVDDAVYIQNVINETVAALTQQARQIGAVKLVGPSAFVAAVQAGHQMIPIDDPAQAQSIRYIEPPPRSAVLVDTLDDNTQALYAIYGLNDVLTGAENAKSGTSAKSIAYLNKLDSMKSAGAARSLNKAIVRMCRQTLKLFQQYVKAPRLAQIAGESSLMGAESFIGADLAGVDVKMESASSRTQMRGQIAGDAQAQMEAGNPDPALKEVSKTGVQDTAFARASRDMVRAQAQAALMGEPQSADREVDPTVAADEISMVLASNRGNPNAQALHALLAEYQAMLQQTAAPAAQPGAAPSLPGEGQP